MLNVGDDVAKIVFALVVLAVLVHVLQETAGTGATQPVPGACEIVTTVVFSPLSST